MPLRLTWMIRGESCVVVANCDDDRRERDCNLLFRQRLVEAVLRDPHSPPEVAKLSALSHVSHPAIVPYLKLVLAVTVHANPLRILLEILIDLAACRK